MASSEASDKDSSSNSETLPSLNVASLNCKESSVRISPSEECEGSLVAGVGLFVVRRDRANEDLDHSSVHGYCEVQGHTSVDRLFPTVLLWLLVVAELA
jgi:hypothetical protein